ncbi:MAG: D-alanyl-D-alanine carboxypeptidase, partial [Thiotrichaceae bacterium]|nr:D-alanyl-D-alanine carboxypeptidase [Thiotrichaceae bacterium]
IIIITLLLSLSLHNAVAYNALDKFSSLKNAGLLLQDADGKALVSDNANKRYIPASTTKIVTALLALQSLGEGYRFQTNFYFDDQNSTLWVKGSGDPFLVSEELAIIAQQLRALGLTHINRIGLDGSFFQKHLVMPGTGKTNNPYDAIPSALAANFNTVHIKKIKGRVVSAESQTPLTAYAKSMSKRFKRGKLRVNTGRKPKNAERYFGELLSAFLKKERMTGRKTLVWGKAPNIPIFYQHINSKTLGEMVQPMLKYSTNFIANQLVLVLSAEHYRRPANASDVRHYMEGKLKQQFQWRNFSMRDGAGLSRKNRLSPQHLVELLGYFKPWRHLLPEIERRVYAKSGTLNRVSTLAGYVVDKGQWKPFAIMMNQSVPYKLRNKIAKELSRI